MKSILALLLMVLVQSCHTPQYTADKLPERQLVFGRGGGFSGLEITYILLENGQFWKEEGVGTSPVALPAISRSQASQLFEKAESHLFGEVSLNTVGNTYSFVGLHMKDRRSRITWTGELPAVDPALSSMIHDLFSHIPQK